MVPEADPLRQNPQCGFSLTLWLSGHYSLVGLGCYCYNHLLIYLFITHNYSRSSMVHLVLVGDKFCKIILF